MSQQNQTSGIQGGGLRSEENVEAFREATPEDIFGEVVPSTIWQFRPSGSHHGNVHPDNASIYIDIECSSDRQHFGCLHGYVDPSLFAHLMRVLKVEGQS